MKTDALQLENGYIDIQDDLVTVNAAGKLDVLPDLKASLSDLLHNKGAILLRGFKVNTEDAFKSVANLFITDFMRDNGEHNAIAGIDGVFTPVAYSAKEKLLWHNENSFNQNWPLVIMFGAARPADRGGETPIVDSRKMLAALDKNVLREFKQKGVMYTRTHGFGFGRSWQETYKTTDKAVLEQALNSQNIQFEWFSEDQLITRQIRPAVVEHPITKELAWFNQSQHWHPYCLQADVRASLLQIFPDEHLPRNCHYGDGTKIPNEVMQHILDTYASLEFAFPWQLGDVMVLDNVLFAHARNPYEGERKLFVTMGKQATFIEDVQVESRLVC